MGILRHKINEPIETNIVMHVQQQTPFPKAVQSRAVAGIILIDLSKNYNAMCDDIRKSLRVLDQESRGNNDNMKIFAYGMAPDITG